MNYIAQANIISENLEVKKGELITEKEYDTLPDSLKRKFVKGKVSPMPKEFNKIIGDSKAERAKREQLAKQVKKGKGNKK